MRIGVAGVGKIGAFRASSLKSLDPDGTVVVTGRSEARTREVARSLGLEAVTGIDALLREDLDGLVVATATDAHADLILAGVEAGVPVFCEKPVALDIDGTLAVLRRVLGSDVPVQVGFQRRFDPAFRRAQALVATGALGWVHTMRSGTLDPSPPPPEYLPGSGGLFRDCLVHDFDIVRWVSGREVREVYAVGANRGEAFFRECGDIDAAAAILTLDDDTFVSVSGSRYNGRGYDVRLEVLGSEDSVAVGLDHQLPLASLEGGVTFPSEAPHTHYTSRFATAFVEELAAFVRTVEGAPSEGATVADSLEALSVARACEVSRSERRPVRLEEIRGVPRRSAAGTEVRP